MRLLLAGLLMCAGVMAQKGQPRVTTLQAPAETFIRDGLLQDVDQDGRLDLVLLRVSGSTPRTRTLAVHLRRKGSTNFAARADRTVTLPPDVTAFCVADVEPAPGSELLLLTRTGVFSAPPKAGVRPRRILDVAFLWQFVRDMDALPLDHVTRDLDGDGLDDLLVPEAGGWTVALQDRDQQGSSMKRVFRLRIPAESNEDSEPLLALGMRGRRARRGVAIRLGVGNLASDDEPLIDVGESCPAPQVQDFDGDGDLDVIARTSRKLLVWSQNPRGVFPAAPDRAYEIPVVADRARLLDVSYAARLRDLNGDRRADCVFLAGNQRSEDVRSQILVYVQGHQGRRGSATTADAPLFGPRGRPHQLLPLAGFAAMPDLEDVNGDGRPDLSLATFRPDLIDSLRSGSSRTIEVGFLLFLNRGPLFSPRPDLSVPVKLRASDLEAAQGFLPPVFFADVNGDGMRDLLLQNERSRIQVRTTRRARKGWTLASKPWWELTWNGWGFVRLERARPGGAPELLVIQGGQALHVELLP